MSRSVDPSDLVPLVIPFERSFDAQLGLDYEQVEPDRVVGTFTAAPLLFDATGRVHCGVFAAVAEAVASVGTAYAVSGDGKLAMGMANDTTTVADVSEGRITAVARRRAATRELWVWEVEATDASGSVCAFSQVLVAVRPGRR